MTNPVVGLAISGAGAEDLLVTLFLMFVAAKVAAEIFERLKQPAVAGEILAGVIIGPSVLQWVQPGELTNALAEIGVIVPFLLGYWMADLWGQPRIESIFIGAAMVATSVGITARVLGQMGLLHLDVSRIILGAAVIDDILGLLILAVVSSFAKGNVDYTQIAATAGLAIGFTIVIILLGARTVNRIRPRVERLRVNQSYVVFGFALCLGLALVAQYIGVAAIIGAFLAGMAMSESAEGTDMGHQAEAVTEFLLPFFLANIGMQLQLSAIFNRGTLIFATLITLLAVASKILGCGLGAWTLGRRKAMQVGMGMVPRGEVGIVVAQIGLGLGAIGNEAFGVVLIMAVATTLIAPPFLVLLFKQEQRIPPDPSVPISSLG